MQGLDKFTNTQIDAHYKVMDHDKNYLLQATVCTAQKHNKRQCIYQSSQCNI